MASTATIGQLKTDVIANTTQYSSALKKAGADTQSFASQIKGMIPSFSLLSVAATAAAAAIAAAYVGLKKLEDLNNTAAKIGTTANELQRLQTAATLSDVDISTLNAGVGKLLRTFGEASTGSKTAVKAFEEIGVSLDDLKGKTATEQFAIVSEALKNIEDPAIRAAAANDIFGRSYGDLLPLILQGKDGITELGEQADIYRQILTEGQTAAVNEAAIAQDRFALACDGASKQLAAALSPAMEGLYDVGASLLTDVLRPILPVLSGLAHVVGFVAKIIATVFTGAIAGLHVALTALLKIGGVFSDTLKEWSDISEAGLKGYGDRLQGYWKDTNNLDGATKQLGDTAEDAYGRAETAAQKLARSQREVLEQTEENITSLQKQWQFDLDTNGQTSRQKQISALRPDAALDETNALKYEISKLEKLDEQLTAKEKQKQLEKDAQELLRDGFAFAQKAQNDLMAAARKHSKEGEEAHKKRVSDEKKANEERIKGLKDMAKTEGQIKTEQTIEAAKALNAGEITHEEYKNIRAKIEGTEPEMLGGPNALPFSSPKLYGSQEARESLLRGATKNGTDPWKLNLSKQDQQIALQREMRNELKKQNSKKEEIIR